MIFLRMGAIALILTCCLHLIGHFSNSPSNDAEKQLYSMMESTPLDLGNGKSITMMNLETGLSLSFSLLFAWTGVLSLVLSYKFQDDRQAIKTLALTNTVFLAIGSAISTYYFFFAPTTCFIVCFFLFLIASITIKPLK